MEEEGRGSGKMGVLSRRLVLPPRRPAPRPAQERGAGERRSHVVGDVDGVQLVGQEAVPQVHALLLAP